MSSRYAHVTSGLSEYVLSMVGKELTYDREGKPSRTGICKAVRRIGWMTTADGRFPAFELLVGGHWTTAFADRGNIE